MNYSRSDIEHMREDALRRTREMHSRARSEGRQESRTHEEHHDGVQAGSSCKEESGNKPGSILGGLLPDNKIDGDKLILILLIIILSNEGADLKLLIALGYILL